MNTSNKNSENTARKAILVLSASQYLAGHPIIETIKTDWSKEKARQAVDKFDNVGFPVDPTDGSGTLELLQQTLQSRPWDGVIVGWCVRGHVEFTELFEKIVAVVVKQIIIQPELKLMFSTGPTNLVETTLRNFPL